MKAFKAFIKPSEAPQRSVKIKIQLTFFSSSGIGTGKVDMFLTILEALGVIELSQSISTRYWPIFNQCFASVPPENTGGFLMFSGGIEMEHWLKMDW